MEKEWFGLIGVVLGFILNLITSWYNRKRETSTEQFYLALQVTLMLDNFVEQALLRTTDFGEYDSKGINRHKTVEPSFDFSSLDVNWKCLPQNLAKRILELSNLVKESKRNIYEAMNEDIANSNIPDFDEFFKTNQYEYAKLGGKALTLSMELKKLAKIDDALSLRRYKEVGKLLEKKWLSYSKEKIELESMANGIAARRK